MRRVAIYLADINHFHGIGEVERNLAAGLARRAADLEKSQGIHFTFLVPKDKVGAYGTTVDYLPIGSCMKTLVNSDFTGILRKLLYPSFDLLHLTHQSPKLHRSFGKKTLVTIHDINFFHNHNCSEHSMQRKIRRMERILKVATHLSFVSQFSEDDVKEHFSITQPCKVVTNGTKDWARVPKEMMANLPEAFLFHLSDLGEKKNAQLLAEMMHYLPDEHLVLAGCVKPENRKRITDIIDRYQLKNVTLMGRISDEEKAYLLSECEAFLFPSRSEGFGLPVLEAMCFGKPTVISRLTSLPEIGGDCAAYYDRLEPEKMAQATQKAILEFQKDEVTNARKVREHALSFSWDRAVDEYVNYYLEILK